MDEQTFQAKLNELMSKIRELPVDQRGRLEDAASAAADRRQRIQASAAELQEALDHLRLSVKYLVFDLEATRRENEYLRRLLEKANGTKRRNDPQDDNFLDDLNQDGEDGDEEHDDYDAC